MQIRIKRLLANITTNAKNHGFVDLYDQYISIRYEYIYTLTLYSRTYIT